MTSDLGTIIVTADEPYAGMHHTQIVYAKHLAKHYQVIFVEAPKKWKFSNVFARFSRFEKKTEQLIVFPYPNRLPARLDRILKINERILENRIATRLRGQLLKNLIVWHFDSYRAAFKLGILANQFQLKHIYHVIDPFYNNPLNAVLAKCCDVLVITSPRNNTRYQEYRDKIVNIPQTLDSQVVQKAMTAKSTNAFHKPYFVLLGTISDDIDLGWLQYYLQELPFQLILIGKKLPLKNEQVFDKICAHQNCHFLGFLNPEAFYPILKNAGAGLVLYNEERRSKICSPLKALNYVMAGIPVISNIDTEMPELENHWVFQCETQAQFLALLHKAADGLLNLNEDLRQSFIANRDIDKSVQLILEKLAQTHAKGG